MAVRSLNPLEQHAGKIFLGLVLLVCLVLVATYVVGNPVGIERGGDKQSVDQISTSVKARNKSLLESIGDKAPARSAVIKPAPGLGEFSPLWVPEIAREALAGDGIPGQMIATGSVSQPLGYLSLPVKLLAPMPQPKLAMGEKVIADREIRYISVCAQMPLAALESFRLDLIQQAEQKKRRLPENLNMLRYAVQVQRREVDEHGQPTSPDVDIPLFLGQGLEKPVDHWKREYPHPGKNPDSVKLREWITRMIGPAPAGQTTLEDWLAQRQEAISRPKFSDGTTPDLIGFEPLNPVPPGFAPVPQPGVGVPGMPAAPGMPAPGMPGAEQPAIREFVYTLDTTIRPASRYAYRIRYVLLNPLLCRFLLVEDPDPEKDENIRVEVASQWSQWSLPISTRRDMYVFLADGEPRFTVIRRVMGQWHAQTFPVQVGKPLGEVRGTIDYRTGLIPVDVRRDVELMRRVKEGGGRIGLTLIRDTQVLLRDDAGNLTVRSLSLDVQEYEDFLRHSRDR